jgi:hypothetical protein
VISSVDNKYFVRLFGVVSIDLKNATQLNPTYIGVFDVPPGIPYNTTTVSNNTELFRYYTIHNTTEHSYYMMTTP